MSDKYLEPPDVWDDDCGCEFDCNCKDDGCDICGMEHGCRCDWDYEAWKEQEMDWDFD